MPVAIVSGNQSLRGATSPAMRALLGVDNSRIDAIFPASHATAHRYSVECYVSSKTKVTKALARARSSISVSFDGWLADNQLDMLGVTAHYLDEHLRVKTVLLGLRRLPKLRFRASRRTARSPMRTLQEEPCILRSVKSPEMSLSSSSLTKQTSTYRPRTAFSAHVEYISRASFSLYHGALSLVL